MRNKWFVYGLLCVALVFGMLAMGCSDPGGLDETKAPSLQNLRFGDESGISAVLGTPDKTPENVEAGSVALESSDFEDGVFVVKNIRIRSTLPTGVTADVKWGVSSSLSEPPASYSTTRVSVIKDREYLWVQVSAGADNTVYYIIQVNITPGRPYVTFEPTGGIFDIRETPASKVIVINDEGTVKLPETPMKKGNAFTGWFTQETDGEQVTADTVFDSNTTVYAQWGNDRDYTPSEWNLGLPSLHRLYSGYFVIGNVMDTTRTTGMHSTGISNTINIPELVAMFRHHYNAVTPENSFKPVNIWPNRNTTPDFSEHDRFIQWANDYGINFFAHVLVWHGTQAISWPTANNATRAQARENMKLYIDTVLGHFKGRVPEWDVVNEAFTDNVTEADLESKGWRGVLRTTDFLTAYRRGADANAGELDGDHIYDAFVFARLADPDATLYYNDFNEEFPFKREAIARMIEDLNDLWVDDSRNTDPARLLIEGMGMQSHFHAGNLTLENVGRVRDSIRRFAGLGVKISVSELDITARTSGSNTTPLTTEDEAHQAALYKALFEIYLDEHESIDRVTIWGRDDYTHWRNGREPCIFTRDTRAKEAFFAIADAAWERAGY